MTKEEKRAYMLEYNARYRNDPRVKAREAARRASPAHKRRWHLQYKARAATPAFRAHKKALHDSLPGRLRWYRDGARQRGIEFSLTSEQFAVFWKQPCAYCGAKIGTIGLDRIDNSAGYVFLNVTSCCSTCNFMKRDMPVTTFVEHCRRVAGYAE